MNGYALTAAIIHALASLAWPAALVWVVWVFRGRLGALLPLLYVKHKDWEASFRLGQAEKEGALLPPNPELSGPEPTPEEKSKFDEIASVSPRAAILELRGELEDVLRNAMPQWTVHPKRIPMNLGSMIRVLRKEGVIDERLSAILDDLRVLGNTAAHGGGEVAFTKDDALRIRKLADEVIKRLQTRIILNPGSS